MLQPDVTITDYAVTAECAFLASRLPGRAGAQRGWLMLFLMAVGVAALAAGTVHGFYPDPSAPAHAVLWRATMLALGTGALAAWALGAGLLCSPSGRRPVTIVAALALSAYAVVVLAVSQVFWIAIAFYLPAAAFLLLAFGIRKNVAGAAGMALTFVAAGIQVARIGLLGLHPDALYHVVQAVGVWLVFEASAGPPLGS
jgi:hypothetical protein